MICSDSAQTRSLLHKPYLHSDFVRSFARVEEEVTGRGDVQLLSLRQKIRHGAAGEDQLAPTPWEEFSRFLLVRQDLANGELVYPLQRGGYGAWQTGGDGLGEEALQRHRERRSLSWLDCTSAYRSVVFRIKSTCI